MPDIIRNPFIPGFGKEPREFAGRTEIITDITYALDHAPDDPSATSLLIGPRGTGKTALLTYLSNYAKANGFISVNVTCIDGMNEEIYNQLIKGAEHLIDSNIITEIKSIKVEVGHVIGAEVGLNKNGQRNHSWRVLMEDIIDKLNGEGVGVLFTIDEVNPKTKDMIEFAANYQHFVRDEKKVVLIMAGLPSYASLLLNDEHVSFLRRAAQYILGPIDDYEVSDAFEKTLRLSEKNIDDDALNLAVKEIKGFPFLFQLVGYRTWREAEDKDVISITDVEKGVELASRDMINRVIVSSIKEIPKGAKQLLYEMAKEGECAKISDIAKRNGKTPGYYARYRKILVELGLVEQAERGTLKFSLPLLKEYIISELEDSVGKTEEEYDTSLADKAYNEHLDSGNDATSISELWNELDI